MCATRGWKDVTLADLQKREWAKSAAKAPKYRNTKTTVEGVVFDSAKEARRWNELRMLEKAGQIRYLERQPKFDLAVRNVVIGAYIADFRYDLKGAGDTWTLVIEDVKGMKGLPLYLWKVKHFNAQYGLSVTEIR